MYKDSRASEAKRGEKNPNYGKKHSPETIRKMREIKLADNNPIWKGDSVGKHALHRWVKARLSRPEFCQICIRVPPYDLANITGKYTRDLSNWKYLCRRCHSTIDRRIDMNGRVCSVCCSVTTYLTKIGNRPQWYYSKNDGRLICAKCNRREWDHAHHVRRSRNEVL
jgi:hypothetical protein